MPPLHEYFTPLFLKQFQVKNRAYPLLSPFPMLLSMFQSVCASGGGGCSSRNRTNIGTGGTIAVKRERIDDDEGQRKAACNSSIGVGGGGDGILSEKVRSLSQAVYSHHSAHCCASNRILSSTMLRCYRSGLILTFEIKSGADAQLTNACRTSVCCRVRI